MTSSVGKRHTRFRLVIWTVFTLVDVRYVPNAERDYFAGAVSRLVQVDDHDCEVRILRRDEPPDEIAIELSVIFRIVKPVGEAVIPRRLVRHSNQEGIRDLLDIIRSSWTDHHRGLCKLALRLVYKRSKATGGINGAQEVLYEKHALLYLRVRIHKAKTQLLYAVL
jgi:hypothetical protein